MPFTTYNQSQVVSPAGKLSLAYVIRNDQNQIAAVDTQTVGPVDFAVYYAHSFTGDEQSRSLRKKAIRINIFGEGSISPVFGSAYMVVTFDNSRTDVYPYSDQSPFPPSGILWRQNTMNTAGRAIDITLFLTGTGLIIREIQLEYTVVG